MITSFEVKNFKSLKSLTLPMQPFMVLVGPNGSGKTNVVHALELLGNLLDRGSTDPAREHGWDHIIRREKKPLRGLTLGVKLLLPHELIDDTLRMAGMPEGAEGFGPVYLEARLVLMSPPATGEVKVAREEIALGTDQGRFVIEADREGLKVDPGPDKRLWALLASTQVRWPLVDRAKFLSDAEEVSGVVTNLLKERSLEHDTERRILRILNRRRLYSPWMEHLAGVCEVFRLRLDPSDLRSDSPFKKSTAASPLGPGGEGLAVAIDRLRGRGSTPAPAFQRLLADLQETYPRIEDITPHRIQPGRLTLLFRERGIADELGQSNVSDGLLHALALLVMLEGGARRRGAVPHAGILAMEEPEKAIHPWSVRRMIERAQKQRERQTIVTTHSEAVVNAVNDPSSLFLVENDDKLGTVVTAARDREIGLDAILRETGQTLGGLWMNGGLGGIPRTQR